MATTLSERITVEPDVLPFLRRHGGEAALQTACAIVGSCFPDFRALEVWLLEDPDEENHTWVKLQVWVPAASPPELLRTKSARFHEELDRQLKLPYHPFSFSLTTQVSPD